MNPSFQVQPIALDDKLLTDLIRSVKGVFHEGFGLKVECRSHETGHNKAISGDVSGVVGLLQDRNEGNLIMTFSKDAIFAILSRVYLREFETIDNVVKEGAAEMTNMVYGHVKTSLNARGHSLKMALPAVVAGAGHDIRSSDNSRNLAVAFGFDSHQFHVIVALQDLTGN